jgi:tetratricopeptide (TPR) repeat protein
MRRLNVLFLLITLAVSVLSAGGIYLLHSYQVRHNASALMTQARTLELGGKLNEAMTSLERYLSIRRSDGSAWAEYARLMDRRSSRVGSRRLFTAYEDAIRYNPFNDTLKRRAAEIAMDDEVRQYEYAEKLLTSLADSIKADPARAAEAAELKDKLGQCLEKLKKLDKAENEYKAAIKLDGTRVAAYGRVARLVHARHGDSDAILHEMLTTNPKSAQALVERFRFRREFGMEADPADIRRALELGPGEADVLIEAANLAMQKNDLKAARMHLEHSQKEYPEDENFYLRAAALEQADRKLKTAEEILQRGIARLPESSRLKTQLTDTLITLGKLEGGDGAIAWLERLIQLGLRDGYVKYFQGRIDCANQSWKQAITKLNMARTLLAGEPRWLIKINQLLARCHRREGETEEWAAAMKRLAETNDPAVLAEIAPDLTEALLSEGQVDAAILNLRTVLNVRPAARLELVQLLIRKNSRMPRGQNWREVEHELQQAAENLPEPCRT